ncbi:MAG: OadG family protein [Marinilabiliaceae bacterium]|nr:OadG family protein [Marinilabiliaceae bacterium]
MEQGLSNALNVLIVGMATVFMILWLVVIIGNLIIRVTNKYWTDEDLKKSAPKSNHPSASKGAVAAIIAAVEIVTNGRGKVTKITKQ